MLIEENSLSWEQLRQVAFELMSKVGLDADDISLQSMTGGGNNRVFRVETKDVSVLLKAYFQHPEDPRDRLGTEFAFSRFAWENGIRCLPQPLGCDRQSGTAIYQFIEGRQLQPQEVTETAVKAALNFYQQLNSHKSRPDAQSLPKGSEACFTIAEHLNCVERRLQRLQGIENSSGINREAAYFIENNLLPVWDGVRNSVPEKADKLGLALDAEIKPEDRCLSPSDFGFHNAIFSKDGNLHFIDFEYAGWDDPAKTVGDFFCQPAVPVPLDYYNFLVEAVVSDLSAPEIERQRIGMLLSVYQIKWCCIMLNDFLPVGSKRRRFAGAVENPERKKVEQLQKARRAMERIEIINGLY